MSVWDPNEMVIKRSQSQNLPAPPILSVTKPVTRIKAVTIKSLLEVMTEYCVLEMLSSCVSESQNIQKAHSAIKRLYLPSST